MTSPQHVRLTCLLKFPVYRYLYPPTQEYGDDFTRLAVPGDAARTEWGRGGGGGEDKMYPEQSIAEHYRQDFAFSAVSGARGRCESSERPPMASKAAQASVTSPLGELAQDAGRAEEAVADV